MKFLLLTFTILILISCQNENNSTERSETTSDGINNENSNLSEYTDITCPKCGHTETVKLPTTTCKIVYNCKKCKTTIKPIGDDCCVYCSYGTHKCPSIQDVESTK